MSATKQFRAAVIIGYMLSITWLRRNLLSLVWLFATPFSLLFIITVTTGGRSFALGVVGSLLLVLSTVGTGLAGDATWYRLETKLQDFFVASPVNQIGYLLGIAFAGLFFASPALVVLLPLLVYIGLPLITLPRIIVSRRSLAVLISHRISRLNLHLEPAKRMAVRTPPKRPGWNTTASLLPSRDSSPRYSTDHICYSHNQRRPSHTRRNGECPDPTVLVSSNRLAAHCSLTLDCSSCDFASG